jgi:hypothetical protein
MALTRQAINELHEFARGRHQESAALRALARGARFDVSTRRAYAGELLNVEWAVASAALPVALRIGDESEWALVEPAGNRQVEMPARSLSLSLKVGRFLAQRIVVQLVVVPLDWHLIPEPTQLVAFGKDAVWGYHAAGANSIALREGGRDWQLLPASGRIVIPQVFVPRRAVVRIRGPHRLIEQTLNALPRAPNTPTLERLVREARGDGLSERLAGVSQIT